MATCRWRARRWASGRRARRTRPCTPPARRPPVTRTPGHGDVPMAVEAMRVGAFDFLEKPFNPDRMTELAKKATQARRLALDSRALRRELPATDAAMRRATGS